MSGRGRPISVDIVDSRALVGRVLPDDGNELTGLPIDFQVQRMTEANERHQGKQRNPLGRRHHHGTVEEVWDDGATVLIYFDDGVGAPYSAADVEALTSPAAADDAGRA